MKKRATSFFLLLIFSLGTPFGVFAWGGNGHRMVAEVAFYYLDNATKQKVLKALKGVSIEKAATWMDDMRSDTSFNYMHNWHFVNINKGKTYQQHHDDALFQLNRIIEALKNRAKLHEDTVQRDLFILFHLIGDIHQPLHVGYGSDIGGNNIYVTLPSPNDLHKTTDKLHRVWDDDIIFTKQIKTADCIGANHYTAVEVTALQQPDLLTWMAQSRAYLIPNVYQYQNKILTTAYYNQNAPIIEKQIGIAGLRLAGLLNLIFKS